LEASRLGRRDESTRCQRHWREPPRLVEASTVAMTGGGRKQGQAHEDLPQKLLWVIGLPKDGQPGTNCTGLTYKSPPFIRLKPMASSRPWRAAVTTRVSIGGACENEAGGAVEIGVCSRAAMMVVLIDSRATGGRLPRRGNVTDDRVCRRKAPAGANWLRKGRKFQTTAVQSARGKSPTRT